MMLFVLEGIFQPELQNPLLTALPPGGVPAAVDSICLSQHCYYPLGRAALTLGSAHIINHIRLESITSRPTSASDILDLKSNKQRSRLTLSRQVVNIPRNICIYMIYMCIYTKYISYTKYIFHI